MARLTLYTLNESYNRLLYILAASAENKNKKSMIFIYIEEKSLSKSFRVILLQQDA